MEAAHDKLLSNLQTKENSWQHNLTDAQKESNQAKHQVTLICRTQVLYLSCYVLFEYVIFCNIISLLYFKRNLFIIMLIHVCNEGPEKTIE